MTYSQRLNQLGMLRVECRKPFAFLSAGKRSRIYVTYTNECHQLRYGLPHLRSGPLSSICILQNCSSAPPDIPFLTSSKPEIVKRAGMAPIDAIEFDTVVSRGLCRRIDKFAECHCATLSHWGFHGKKVSPQHTATHSNGR
jgi:hypothetical protein